MSHIATDHSDGGRDLDGNFILRRVGILLIVVGTGILVLEIRRRLGSEVTGISVLMWLVAPIIYSQVIDPFFLWIAKKEALFVELHNKIEHVFNHGIFFLWIVGMVVWAFIEPGFNSLLIWLIVQLPVVIWPSVFYIFVVIVVNIVDWFIKGVFWFID